MPDRDGAMPTARATHASHRANLRCLGLSVGIAIALSGCGKNEWLRDENPQFSVYYEGGGVWLIRDKVTTCEYVANGRNGGIVLRADPNGIVTPGCAASGIETRSAIDPQGRGPKGESPPDAQTLSDGDQ